MVRRTHSTDPKRLIMPARDQRRRMSSDRAKALRDECLEQLELARGTPDYRAIEKRLHKLTAVIVAAETREADERYTRRQL